MFRINYLRPEQMPPHQRDFPPREQLQELPGAAGFRALVMMVAWYIVAMFAGILLLGHLTAPRPNTGTAATSGALSK
jgi:hypothetical protein